MDKEYKEFLLNVKTFVDKELQKEKEQTPEERSQSMKAQIIAQLEQKSILITELAVNPFYFDDWKWDNWKWGESRKIKEYVLTIKYQIK